jgi:putative sterol carrier protein
MTQYGSTLSARLGHRARAARETWSISHHDALLVIPGVLSTAPRYLRSSVGDDVNVSYELRFRGGGRYRMAVRNGAAEITAAGDKADCVITADPVAFLQLGYGRIPQWRPIIGGKMFVSGRKPWLAVRFASLLSSP